MQSTTERRLAKRSGLGLLDVATLCGVVAVVVLVSLPRLRVLAMGDNETDAVQIVRLLGTRLDADPGLSLADLARTDPAWLDRFEDTELVGETGLLRCHGYLFEAVHGPEGSLVVAWPWTTGRTGTRAFLRLADGTVRVHDDPEGHWQGLASRPPRDGDWQPLAE